MEWCSFVTYLSNNPRTKLYCVGHQNIDFFETSSYPIFDHFIFLDSNAGNKEVTYNRIQLIYRLSFRYLSSLTWIKTIQVHKKLILVNQLIYLSRNTA